MPGRIHVTTELVLGDLACLRRVLPRAACQHFPLGGVSIVDGEVEVERLRSPTRRPGRGSKVVGKLERDRGPADG